MATILKWFAVLSVLVWCFSCRDVDHRESVEKAPVYKEKYRPQFHFSPRENWMNNPNGMVFHEGEYHLFYQYYPDSTIWGPMHWGHAVSSDLVRWEHLPIALYPDEIGYIFSGCVVVDQNNTSGFGVNGPPLVAIFTQSLRDEDGKSQVQSLAYSNDKGRTWTKYDSNPVLDEDLRAFRGPKVFWHEATKKWIMSIVASPSRDDLTPDRVHFYSSKNLKNWTFENAFGEKYGAHAGKWECPDLFQLKVKNTRETKWVLIVSINPRGPYGGSGTQYFIGDFDGKTFSCDAHPDDTYWLDYGRDNHAGVTWSGIPESDGRRLFIGWMSNWDYAQLVPTERWRGAMTIPRELGLYFHDDKYYLTQKPARELSSLRTEEVKLEPKMVTKRYDLLKDVRNKNGLYEVILKFRRPEKNSVKIWYSKDIYSFLAFGAVPQKNRIYVNRGNSGVVSFHEKFGNPRWASTFTNPDTINLHAFIDKSSLELFSDQGMSVMSDLFFPAETFDNLMLYADNNEIELLEGSVYVLNSIWQNSKQ